jgi:hypothetical protein
LINSLFLGVLIGTGATCLVAVIVSLTRWLRSCRSTLTVRSSGQATWAAGQRGIMLAQRLLVSGSISAIMTLTAWGSKELRITEESHSPDKPETQNAKLKIQR